MTEELFLYMVFEKTVEQVVNENHVYARALHYLGIDFFEAPNRKLKEICKERGLERRQVIKTFYEFDSCNRFSFEELKSYPIELLTQYLKHAHHLFIKEKLPYIVHLVKKRSSAEGLKDLLPEFIEDFIKHIYEEEDSTFKYIDILCSIKKGSVKASFDLVMGFRNFSLKNEFEEHKGDDEFGAIRSLMSSFEPKNLHDRVLIHEVQAFDREMIYHAEIENSIFFPKAIELEASISKKIKALTTLN